MEKLLKELLKEQQKQTKILQSIEKRMKNKQQGSQSIDGGSVFPAKTSEGMHAMKMPDVYIPPMSFDLTPLEEIPHIHTL